MAERDPEASRIRSACELAFEAAWYGGRSAPDPGRHFPTGKQLLVSLAVTLALSREADPDRRWNQVAALWRREEPRMESVLRDPRLRLVAEMLAARARELTELPAS